MNATELLKSPVVMNKSVTSIPVYTDNSTIIMHSSVITDIVAAMQAFK